MGSCAQCMPDPHPLGNCVESPWSCPGTVSTQGAVRGTELTLLLCLSRAPSDWVLGALKASQGHREALTGSLCQDTEHLSGSIAELLCLTLGMPAKRGARLSLCCARRLQPCLQIVEYLPWFPPKKKFPVQTLSFLPCLWKIILILPALNESLEKVPKSRLQHSRKRVGGLEGFPWSPYHSFNFLTTKPIARGFWGGDLSPLQSEVLQSPTLNVSPRHQLNEIEGPGGRTKISVDYYFFSLWGDLICVFTSCSANYSFAFPWSLRGSNMADCLSPWPWFMHPWLDRAQRMRAEVALQPCPWVLWLISPTGQEKRQGTEIKAVRIKQLRAMVELGEK